jgi:hypothetical protein
MLMFMLVLTLTLQYLGLLDVYDFLVLGCRVCDMGFCADDGARAAGQRTCSGSGLQLAFLVSSARHFFRFVQLADPTPQNRRKLERWRDVPRSK